MPRSGGGVYSLPAGSIVADGVDDILAAQHNDPLNDIALDLNTPRPISAGGTGAASAAAALVNLGLTATAAELNVLDGVTATTAELNILDGVTATAAEINHVDGVTSPIQTQLDGKQPLDTDLTQLAALTRARGSLIRGGASAWEVVALGTSGQVLTSDGTDAVWGNNPFGQLGSTVALSSGSTTISSTIPTDASEIIIAWESVSTDATTTTRVRVGNGALQSTGYATDVYAGAVGGNFTLSDSFHMQHAGQVASQVNRGSILLTRVASDRWFGQGTNHNSTQSCIYNMSGTVVVTGGITHAGMVTASGNFDAGNGWVAWRR